jgi:hypothetical protein
MSVSRVRENRMHGSMRRRETPRRQSALPCGAGRLPPTLPSASADRTNTATRTSSRGELLLNVLLNLLLNCLQEQVALAPASRRASDQSPGPDFPPPTKPQVW